MKHSNFYNMYMNIEERALQELIKAVKAHGGTYIFDTDPSSGRMGKVLVVRAEGEEGVFDFRLTSVAVNDMDELVINGIDLGCNECIEIDINNVIMSDIAYIIDEIPPVNGIDEVKICPLEIGQEVYWKDPDNGRSSGFYKVNEIPEQWNEETPIWISDGYSLAEVNINELWIQATR